MEGHSGRRRHPRHPRAAQGHPRRGRQGGVPGDAVLFERVPAVKPKLHVFGHIHESYGRRVSGATTFVDAAAGPAQVETLPRLVRLRCTRCGTDRALPFSCKIRGLCPSCGARRAHDLIAHLLSRVLPKDSVRQYVLPPPAELVGLLAARNKALSALVQSFLRAIFAGSSAAEPRRTSGFDVHVGRRIEADDEHGRTSLVRYLARPPFAEAQLEWLDDEHLRLTFRSPTHAGQSSVVLGRVQLLR